MCVCVCVCVGFQSQLADTNYLHVLDKVAQDIVSAVQSAITMGSGVGDSVRVPRSDVPVVLTRKPTVPELSRIRRQFVKLSSMLTGSDADAIGRLFVEHLNKALAS